MAFAWLTNIVWKAVKMLKNVKNVKSLKYLRHMLTDVLKKSQYLSHQISSDLEDFCTEERGSQSGSKLLQNPINACK